MLLEQCVILAILVQTASASILVPHLAYDHFMCWLNQSASDAYKQELVDHCSNLESIHLDTPSERGLTKLHEKTHPDCERLYDIPLCYGSSNGWTDTKRQQVEMFYNTADYGYIKQRRRELRSYCSPRSSHGSSLQCTDYVRYCIGHNLIIDLNHVKTLGEPLQYRTDLLRPGDIQGVECDYKKEELLSQDGHKSHLMSWFDELSNFQAVDQSHCDVVIEKPVVLMKLDATTNMYHHFCDFLNLYLSQLVNQSNFDLDVQIITWDSNGDLSNFASMWKVFTSNPLMTVVDLSGSRVCLRSSIMFSLLPRMIHGLYYNMPLVPGCQASSLIRSFNRHILTRLGLPVSENIVQATTGLRVVFISRSTQHRRVLNEQQLIEGLRQAVKNQEDVTVQAVNFSHRMPFESQLSLSSVSDVLIGMHGAGLTHTLFQPDWAALFELYNCEDRDCYHDLARLRGTHYVTWQNNTKLEAVPVSNPVSNHHNPQGDKVTHAKFVNYRFDVDEFVRITLETLKVVRQRRSQFIEEIMHKWWLDLYKLDDPKTYSSQHEEL